MNSWKQVTELSGPIGNVSEVVESLDVNVEHSPELVELKII